MQDHHDLSTLRLLPIEPIPLAFDNPTEESIAQLTQRLMSMIELLKKKQIPYAEEPDVIEIMYVLNQKRVYEFIKSVNHDLVSLNRLISDYNQALSLTEKTSLLQDIKQTQTNIDHQYPESVISRCEEYRTQLYDNFFLAIQGQETQLRAIADPQNEPTPPPYQFNFSKFLQKMHPVKLNHFLEILHGKKEYNKELESLYQAHEQDCDEFLDFLKTHAITFTGGHNSSNFKITPLDPSQSPYILKIENRLNQPRAIVDELEKKLPNVTIPPDISRRAYFQGRDEKFVVRNIVIQKYCSSGSLFDYAKENQEPTTKLNSALVIYSKMGQMILDISQNGAVFPDMKNSNWLLDQEQLLIADEKSFRSQNAKGYIEMFSDLSQWYGAILKSPKSMPPECSSTEAILADPFHAFSWGKNLYEYLIATTDPFEFDTDYQDLVEGEAFNFNFNIFKVLPEGPLLKKLICDTVRANPHERISMVTALEQLQYIQLISTLYKTIRELLTTSKFPYDVVSKYMESLLKLKSSALNELKDELNETMLNRRLQFFQTSLHAEYRAKFTRIIDDIAEILKEYPSSELQEVFDETIAEFQNLKPYNFDQFEADLDDLLFTVKEHKANIASSAGKDQGEPGPGPGRNF